MSSRSPRIESLDPLDLVLQRDQCLAVALDQSIPQLEQQKPQALGEGREKLAIILPHLIEELDRAAMQGHDEAIADDHIDVRDTQSSVGEMRRRQRRMQAFVVDVVAAAACVQDGLFDGEVIDLEQAQGPLGGPGVADVEVDPAGQTPGAGGAGLLDRDGTIAPVLEVELYDGDRCHGRGPRNGGRNQGGPHAADIRPRRPRHNILRSRAHCNH